MTTPTNRSAPLFRPALLLAAVLLACSAAEEKEVAPVVQDTMLLHDLAQANRNTAATDMDTTIPVVVRSRTEDESDGLVAVAGGPNNASQILTPSGGAQPRPPASTEPRIAPPRRARDAPAPSTVPPSDLDPASGDPCDSRAAADQRTCLNRSIARSDANLNRVYGELTSQARLSGGAELEERFRVRQRAWIITRDEECRRQTRSQEGELWARIRGRCLADYSARRTAELQASLNNLRGLGSQ